MLDRLRRTTRTAVPGFDPLPPPASVEAIEFLEFAMDDASAAGFEPVLQGLGFAPAGAHKSKDVVRWRQGDVNIIVNREKEGFAHSFNITHGPSVCAIALRVADAFAALDRAQRLLDRPFRQAVGPGELDIPAVRGVGGSLLYFIDGKTELGRWWDVDFRPIGGGGQQGAGLTRIDHVSQSMYYEEMLSWLLFYTSLFDVRKAPVLDVIDPGGVMQSQAVETEDRTIRLVLNASQSRQAMASRFVEDFFGSGVQQIALACDDIYRTVDRLRENGVELLPIPDNYYDDLSARTDLDEARIDRLRHSNLLCDGDGPAQFTHVYTKTLPGGFFFEIVERRGGYRGYGAVNAPIRLAAQARLTRSLAV